jgi:TonB-linked SusC/RagA family outer membrane protein
MNRADFSHQEANVVQPIVKRAVAILTVLMLAAVAPLSAQGANGQVSGTVVSQETGQPLGAVQVFLDGTSRGTITRADGTFTLGDVPPGTYTVVAQSIGYQTARQGGVTVTAGSTAAVNVQMVTNVLAIQEVVVTGLVDPTEGVRSPITVASVTREMMPVQPAGGAQLAIQGRVAGATVIRTDGRPGTEGSIVLRTPTSMRGNNQPLMVVDGVILGGTSADIESMDIESIEVIKGAAATSLYGSRAAAGVIAITTNRGRHLAAGQTRFSARTEMGHSFVPSTFKVPQHHAFAVDAEGFYVDRQGNRTDRSGRFEPAVAFMDNPFPPGTQLYDNVGAIFRPGQFNTQNFQIAQNHETTNFSASVNRYRELGSLEGNDGYTRNAFRINLDHRFRNTMSLGISTYYSRADVDNLIGGIGLLGNQFYDMLNFPQDIDILRKDEDCSTPIAQMVRCYMQVPDPTVNIENPIWRQLSRESISQRDRALASADLRWNPFNWLSGVANVSYDRAAIQGESYTAKGVPTVAGGTAESNGSISFSNNYSDTFNASAQASLRRDFGALNTRTTFRGLVERDVSNNNSASGTNFYVENLRSISAAADRNSGGSRQEIASTGYLWDTAFDYDGKYIATVLVRRDGSSLFGPENRWHTYYRGALAYRLSEEPWFNIPNVNEFKLKFSQGTAGGRPSFGNRFETWNVGASGISKGQLGNRALRPEHTTEREFGLDMILFDRVSVELVHARQETTDQIVNLQVPAITGYSHQWLNAGTMTGNTTELVIESRVINRPNFTWTTNIVADRSRSLITEWNGPCHVQFISRLCEGTNHQKMYGIHFYRDVNELPAEFAAHRNQFQVNDDGFVVWVGEGNTYRDGIAKSLWGTSTSIGGQNLQWGHVIAMRDESGATPFVEIGSGEPDLNLGWLNTVRRGNLTLSAQFHASIGHQLFNGTNFYNGILSMDQNMEQAGKSDELKKPMSYYRTAYAGFQFTNWGVEDASFLKLRTVSASYRVSDSLLDRVGLSAMGLDNVSLGVVGRNIFTITPYSGFDPEGGLVSENRITALDWYSYPLMRNLTATIEIGF